MRENNKVAVITEGGHGIGKATAEAFRTLGVKTYVIDATEGDWFVGDIGDKDTLERFTSLVIEKEGHVDYLVNYAPPMMKGMVEKYKGE